MSVAFFQQEGIRMMKNFGLSIMILGLVGVCGCVQAPEKSDTAAAQLPATAIFARGAVEVGRIQLAERLEHRSV
ncbi:MAG TPA: hypothetical protein VHN14_17635 [Kofleriaceae bacterium]|nr:hypothetical protein [Kofleriaceae bacterium]